MANRPLRLHPQPSAFRRIAAGTWGHPKDPSIYSSLTVRVEPALDFVEKFRKATGRRLTLTHLVVRAVAQALRECADANAMLRFRRVHLRERVDVSMLVFVDEGGQADLSAVKTTDADTKPLLELVDELEAKTESIRAGTDVGLERTRALLSFVPAMLMGLVLRLVDFLTNSLNIDLSRWGVPNDPFGGAVVTSLGSLGVEQAFVPLVAFTRAPILIAPGVVHEQPVVEDGRVVVGKVMTICLTLDHRLLDGAHGAALLRSLRRALSDPLRELGPWPSREAQSA